MIFNDHSSLKGLHAFLGASNYHWIRYSDDKLINTYYNMLAKEKGTRLHDFARECIELRQRLPRSKKSLNCYVNDAITFRMTPEQILYYSMCCFGTADSISFTNNLLRIHDLKTGQNPGHIEQLMIYAALFCLEYHYKPNAIQMELRIYQNDEILYCDPDPIDIEEIMNKIIHFDKEIHKIEKEGGTINYELISG